MNKIGVMQGRLLPKFEGRYQAHPLNYWQDEFEIAKKLDIGYIEFILDYENVEINPLIKENGIQEILDLVNSTGVSVKTVCADYFMEAPLHSENTVMAARSASILRKLLQNVSKIGVTDIVIPCVDGSSLNTKESIVRFIKTLSPLLHKAEECKVNLSLETDLAPEPFSELLSSFKSERLTVNYDVGNSASMGFNLIDEFDSYGNLISDIHIKDRVFGGESVELGKGNVDFELFFNKLKEMNYEGPLVMQAYRDDEGLKMFEKQLDWVKKYIYE